MGKIVSIDIETGEFHVESDVLQAAEPLHQARPDAALWSERIGYDAVYALGGGSITRAGIKSGEPAIKRGREFLMRTQSADGSWPMTSRPTKPGGEGCKSLVPIIAAGSAWAVLGLVRTL